MTNFLDRNKVRGIKISTRPRLHLKRGDLIRVKNDPRFRDIFIVMNTDFAGIGVEVRNSYGETGIKSIRNLELVKFPIHITSEDDDEQREWSFDEESLAPAEDKILLEE